VYSLAHIALPFSSDDPVYGIGDSSAKSSDTLRFGALAAYGESGFLALPISTVMRQHWNPFYSLVERKVSAFFEEHVGDSGQ
jgi:hypothetical protein